MSFWGIEVKPGKPHPHHSDDVQGKLRVTQATLGLGLSKERCILQCSVRHRSPIFVCSLLPGKAESCSLNLEFTDELVAFSVIGPRSIHLCGYFDSEEGDHLRDEYEYDWERILLIRSRTSPVNMIMMMTSLMMTMIFKCTPLRLFPTVEL